MKHRYYEVLQRLEKAGINPKNTNIVHLEGIDGSTSLPYSKEIYSTDDIARKEFFLGKLNDKLRSHGYISRKVKTVFKPGQIAYYYSFLKMIRHAKGKGYNRVLFLEDDVFFTSTFSKRIMEIVKGQEDILFVGTSHKHWNRKAKVEETNWVCPERSVDKIHVEYPLGCLRKDRDRELNNAFLGTFACVINSSAYDKILALAYPMRYPLDVYLGKLYRERQLTCSFYRDPPVYVEYNGNSHTGSLNSNGIRK
jgi:hypothetical protein